MSERADSPGGQAPLAALFLAACGAAPEALAPPPRLEEQLQELLRAGASAWPGVALEPADFIRHLAARLAADGDPQRQLDALCAGDLYLACACARGVEGAVELFERRFLSQVAAHVGRIDNDPQVMDEVKQQLRHRLLVGDHERGPRIADYSGRGALGSWVRVAAVRTALNLRQRGDLPRGGDEVVLARLEATANPEIELVRSRYLEEFRGALRTAFSQLSAKERNLLRLYFQEGLGSAHIARALHVDRATVKRWLAAARRALFAESKRLLRERLQLDSSEFHSLLRVLRSHLDLSLTGLLLDDE